MAYMVNNQYLLNILDKVYDENTKTTDVYDDVAKPIVEAAAAGFNGTIFAYGQTSSGKTYTMTGTEESLGIIPLSVMNLFDIIKNIPDRDFLIRYTFPLLLCNVQYKCMINFILKYLSSLVSYTNSQIMLLNL